MNRCILLGRFAADPEMRYSANGDTAITRGRIAVDRRFKREGEPTADFLNILAFGKTAESIEKYFKKGSMILVQTHFQPSSYTNKDGQKVYTYDFIVDEWEFAGSTAKKEEPKAEKKASADGFVSIPDGAGDDLPWD